MAVDDSYTKALLHMDGSDGSTTFTDESGKTWTANGNAQIDTAQSKFGGASGLFDGSGDWLHTSDSEDFNVGSGNFTIDFWLRRNVTGVQQYIAGQNDSSASASSFSFVFYTVVADKIRFQVYSGGTAYNIESTATISDTTTWHHVAGVRDGNVLRLFIDGTQEGTVSVTGVTVNNSTNQISIGRTGEYNGGYLNGWIDEFRFSKGIARWTANFTPPTSAYAPPSSGGIGFLAYF